MTRFNKLASFQRVYQQQPHYLSDKSDVSFNSSLPGQNSRYFGNNFRYILVNDKFGILITILLKLVPKGPMDINPALV